GSLLAQRLLDRIGKIVGLCLDAIDTHRAPDPRRVALQENLDRVVRPRTERDAKPTIRHERSKDEARGEAALAQFDLPVTDFGDGEAEFARDAPNGRGGRHRVQVRQQGNSWHHYSWRGITVLSSPACHPDRWHRRR